jgi:hypothetical protein
MSGASNTAELPFELTVIKDDKENFSKFVILGS